MTTVQATDGLRRPYSMRRLRARRRDRVRAQRRLRAPRTPVRRGRRCGIARIRYSADRPTVSVPAPVRPAQYPFHPSNPYRSLPALPETYLAQQDFLGLSKAVIVNGAGYGSDSRYLLETLDRHPGRFRGVTYVKPDIAPAALVEMRARDVRGARFAGGPAYAHLPKPTAAIAKKLADADWHLEFLTFTPGGMAAEKHFFLGLPNTIVIDHFGRLDATKGLADPGFTALLELLDTGSLIRASRRAQTIRSRR